MKTPTILGSSSVSRDIVQDKAFHVLVLVWNERDTVKGDQCHILREQDYISQT